jgi:FtsP/CotA-like multicopper oxidase with cupredoxin domain
MASRKQVDGACLDGVACRGAPVNEPFLRDTISAPYHDGKTLKYPSVRLRMDFRDPNAVGHFCYHCHLLEHDDGGTMGLFRVEPTRSSETVKP